MSSSEVYQEYVLAYSFRQWYVYIYLQPVLANKAHCYICTKQELLDSELSERTIVHVDVDVSCGALYECSSCWKIAHPYCVLQREIKLKRETSIKKEFEEEAIMKTEESVVKVEGEGGDVKLVQTEVAVTVMDVMEVVNALQYREAMVNEDLPSSWECPKCCCQEKVRIAGRDDGVSLVFCIYPLS